MSSVYLAGPIAGLTYDEATNWRNVVEKALVFDDYYIEVFSPMRGHEALKADKRISSNANTDYPLRTDDGITARDKFDVKRCDIVLFNMLDAPKESVGTCVEFGWASAYDKLVILVMEPEGNPHDHPMIRSIAQFRVDTLDKAIELIKKILCPSGMCNDYSD